MWLQRWYSLVRAIDLRCLLTISRILLAQVIDKYLYVYVFSSTFMRKEFLGKGTQRGLVKRISKNPPVRDTAMAKAKKLCRVS